MEVSTLIQFYRHMDGNCVFELYFGIIIKARLQFEFSFKIVNKTRAIYDNENWKNVTPNRAINSKSNETLPECQRGTMKTLSQSIINDCFSNTVRFLYSSCQSTKMFFIQL